MTEKPKPKWRTTIGLVMLIFAILLNWEWIWGLLFLYWVIPDLFTGSTYFIEEIRKQDHPVLYWSIVAIWLFVSIYALAGLFFDLPQ